MIKLENISYRSSAKLLLDNISIDFSDKKCWAITGANGSGKSLLAMIMSGILNPYSGSLISDEKIGYASFELQQKIMAEERKKDNSRFMHGSVDPGTLVNDFIADDCKEFNCKLFDKYKLLFGLERVMERGLRFLSTGEFRKVLLCKAFSAGPDTLIIDDPFDGLDVLSRENLNKLIIELIKSGERIFIVTSRYAEIPNAIKNILYLDNGKTAYIGNTDSYSGFYKSGADRKTGIDSNILLDEFITLAVNNNLKSQKNITAEDSVVSSTLSSDNNSIIEMKNVSVRYNEIKIISDINWSVKKGDRWKITGPNGSGKSTLMSLINGDNPKAYLNDITLFGKKKGSGESIWDIKKKIGFVSGDLQMNFRVRTNILDTVLSGFFDSIGLYSNVSGLQMQEALKWLKAANLEKKKEVMFDELSYGEKRVALIVRAFIKKPELLILDEPCQRLDEENTISVISLINIISENKDITILLITHDINLLPKGFNKHLSFYPYPAGGYTAYAK